ncbi:DUF5660 domain-containing protein [Candidatus Microgenomates bacterium]|nr:DUF5660 domain-containing protein [Candidatus Microgenomates bacterium]
MAKTKINPWGDLSVEKDKKGSSDTIGWGQQLKGLVNPNGFLDQMFGGKGSEGYPSQKEQKKPPQRMETLVFSRKSYESHTQEQQLQCEIKGLLKQLKDQITVLEKSEKSLTSEITKIKVEQLPNKTGIYYLRFFEWLITIVRQLRVKVEEGIAWLETFTRRKKKMGYWKMYKKHGTTFGLSHERTLATQTG